VKAGDGGSTGGATSSGFRSDRSRSSWAGDFMLRKRERRRLRFCSKGSFLIRISIAATAIIVRIVSAIHPQGMSRSIPCPRCPA
jgi:hypothetical protein